MKDYKPHLRSILDTLGPLPHITFPEHPFAAIPCALQEQVKKYPVRSDAPSALQPRYQVSDERSALIKRMIARLYLIDAVHQQISTYADVLRHIMLSLKADSALYQKELVHQGELLAVVASSQAPFLCVTQHADASGYVATLDKGMEMLKQAKATVFDAGTALRHMLGDTRVVAEEPTSALYDAMFKEAHHKRVVAVAKHLCYLAEGDYIIDCAYTNTLRVA